MDKYDFYLNNLFTCAKNHIMMWGYLEHSWNIFEFIRTNLEGEMKSKHIIGVAVTFILFALAMIMIIGVDTNWGKTTVKKLTLSSADGDVISALLYKPKSATPENPAPVVMYAHGGNDMLEQGSSYAVELARRGYVVISWDYTGAHNSDIATGTSETAPAKRRGLPRWELRLSTIL